MTELEKLIKQKREIEQKIREAKHREVIIGKAKVGIEHYPTDKPDRYYVAIEAGYRSGNRFDAMGRTAWRSIISGESRETVIAGIPEIISDLQKLYDQEAGKHED